MSLTTQQEALFDQIGNVYNAYVYIHAPVLVFEAEIGGFENHEGAYTGVVYGTISYGSINDVEPEMLLCLGFNGISDGGTQRVRGVDTGSNLIEFGRASTGHAEGLVTPDVIGGTIRVYDAYHPFIKAPYIVATPTPYQYKDEQLYPGDNPAQPPVANPGPDRLIITTETSTQIAFDAADVNMPSFPVRNGATIASYLWDMGDGSYDSGTSSSSNPTVSFPLGSRVIHLTVTDSNGVTHTGHRVIATVPPESCIPARIKSLTHTPSGNSMVLEVESSRLPDTIFPRSKVLVSEIENYGQTDLIGFSERFNGWLLQEGVTNDPRTGSERVTLTVEDSAAFLSRNNLFPQSVNIAEGVGGWFAMPDANIDRLMHYILQWHTNILSITGFRWSGLGSTYLFPALTTSGGSIWENVNKLARAFAHELTVDVYGQLKVVGDPHVLPSGGQADDWTLPTERKSGVLTTFSQDRYTTMSMIAERAPTAYWMQALGIIATNDFDNAVVVGCVAPSNAPNFGSNDSSRKDFLTISQEELNVWVANLYISSEGSPIGELTISVINPSMIMDLSERDYVGVILSDYIVGRYDLTKLGNRWTVESVEYSYDLAYKRATYKLKKEIVATRTAHTLAQITNDELVQAWAGFDESISPTTGVIIRGYEGMALTQEELEQTLSKTRLKVYLSEFEADSSGNTTDTEGGSGSGGSIGAGDFDEESEVNGGYLNIAREMDSFLERAQDVYDSISSEPNVKTLFIQFVESSLVSVPTGAASDWIDYIVDTPDTTLPSLLIADKLTLTGDMYCAESAPTGMSEYITDEIDSGEWERWFKFVACISLAQYDAWYEGGLESPISLFPTYECYLWPPQTLTLNTAQIDANTEVEGTVINWSARYRAPQDSEASLVHISASGKYENSTTIKDALYTVNKSTGVVTTSRLSMYVNGPGGWDAVVTPNGYPPYNAAGIYTFSGLVYLHGTSGDWSAAKYAIRDPRTSINGGTGSFSVTFTDLGRA